MAKIENKDTDVEMHLRAIELLNSSLTLPANPDITVTNFNFNINIEIRADRMNKLVFVIVHIDIKNDGIYIQGSRDVDSGRLEKTPYTYNGLIDYSFCVKRFEYQRGERYSLK